MLTSIFNLMDQNRLSVWLFYYKSTSLNFWWTEHMKLHSDKQNRAAARLSVSAAVDVPPEVCGCRGGRFQEGRTLGPPRPRTGSAGPPECGWPTPAGLQEVNRRDALQHRREPENGSPSHSDRGPTGPEHRQQRTWNESRSKGSDPVQYSSSVWEHLVLIISYFSSCFNMWSRFTLCSTFVLNWIFSSRLFCVMKMFWFCLYRHQTDSQSLRGK